MAPLDKENESNERGADKYYKDMQSIHGDTVPPSHHSVSDIPLFRRLHFESLPWIHLQDLGRMRTCKSYEGDLAMCVTSVSLWQAAKRRAITELLFFASVGDLRRCQRIVRLWKLKVGANISVRARIRGECGLNCLTH